MSNGNSVFDVVKNGLGSFFGSSSDENVSDENNNDKSTKSASESTGTDDFKKAEVRYNGQLVGEMRVAEIKAALDKLGVVYKKSDRKAVVETLLRETLASHEGSSVKRGRSVPTPASAVKTNNALRGKSSPPVVTNHSLRSAGYSLRSRDSSMSRGKGAHSQIAENSASHIKTTAATAAPSNPPYEENEFLYYSTKGGMRSPSVSSRKSRARSERSVRSSRTNTNVSDDEEDGFDGQATVVKVRKARSVEKVKPSTKASPLKPTLKPAAMSATKKAATPAPATEKTQLPAVEEQEASSASESESEESQHSQGEAPLASISDSLEEALLAGEVESTSENEETDDRRESAALNDSNTFFDAEDGEHTADGEEEQSEQEEGEAAGADRQSTENSNSGEEGSGDADEYGEMLIEETGEGEGENEIPSEVGEENVAENEEGSEGADGDSKEMDGAGEQPVEMIVDEEYGDSEEEGEQEEVSGQEESEGESDIPSEVDEENGEEIDIEADSEVEGDDLGDEDDDSQGEEVESESDSDSQAGEEVEIEGSEGISGDEDQMEEDEEVEDSNSEEDADSDSEENSEDEEFSFAVPSNNSADIIDLMESDEESEEEYVQPSFPTFAFTSAVAKAPVPAAPEVAPVATKPVELYIPGSDKPFIFGKSAPVPTQNPFVFNKPLTGAPIVFDFNHAPPAAPGVSEPFIFSKSAPSNSTFFFDKPLTGAQPAALQTPVTAATSKVEPASDLSPAAVAFNKLSNNFVSIFANNLTSAKKEKLSMEEYTLLMSLLESSKPEDAEDAAPMVANVGSAAGSAVSSAAKPSSVAKEASLPSVDTTLSTEQPAEATSAPATAEKEKESKVKAISFGQVDHAIPRQSYDGGAWNSRESFLPSPPATPAGAAGPTQATPLSGQLFSEVPAGRLAHRLPTPYHPAKRNAFSANWTGGSEVSMGYDEEAFSLPPSKRQSLEGYRSIQYRQQTPGAAFVNANRLSVGSGLLSDTPDLSWSAGRTSSARNSVSGYSGMPPPTFTSANQSGGFAVGRASYTPAFRNNAARFTPMSAGGSANAAPETQSAQSETRVSRLPVSSSSRASIGSVGGAGSLTSNLSYIQRRKLQLKSDNVQSTMVAKKILDTLNGLSTPMEEQRAKPLPITWNGEVEKPAQTKSVVVATPQPTWTAPLKASHTVTFKDSASPVPAVAAKNNVPEPKSAMLPPSTAKMDSPFVHSSIRQKPEPMPVSALKTSPVVISNEEFTFEEPMEVSGVEDQLVETVDRATGVTKRTLTASSNHTVKYFFSPPGKAQKVEAASTPAPVAKTVAFSSAAPAATPAAAAPATASAPVNNIWSMSSINDGVKCPTCMSKNAKGATKCASCECAIGNADASKSAAASTPASTNPPAPAAADAGLGIWAKSSINEGVKCKTCLSKNSKGATKCASCESPLDAESAPAAATAKPPAAVSNAFGSSPSFAAPATTSAPGAIGTTGFTFNAPLATTSAPSTSFGLNFGGTPTITTAATSVSAPVDAAPKPASTGFTFPGAVEAPKATPLPSFTGGFGSAPAPVQAAADKPPASISFGSFGAPAPATSAPAASTSSFGSFGTSSKRGADKEDPDQSDEQPSRKRKEDTSFGSSQASALPSFPTSTPSFGGFPVLPAAESDKPKPAAPAFGGFGGFGSKTDSASTATTSLPPFGAVPSTLPAASSFGATAAPLTTSLPSFPSFGATPAAEKPASISFGAPAPSATDTSFKFGSNDNKPAAASSLPAFPSFGVAPSSNAAGGAVSTPSASFDAKPAAFSGFGLPSTGSTASLPAFSAPAERSASTEKKPFVFGGAVPPTSQGPDSAFLFGSSATTATTGKPPLAAASNSFGSASSLTFPQAGVAAVDTRAASGAGAVTPLPTTFGASAASTDSPNSGMDTGSFSNHSAASNGNPFSSSVPASNPFSSSTNSFGAPAALNTGAAPAFAFGGAATNTSNSFTFGINNNAAPASSTPAFGAAGGSNSFGGSSGAPFGASTASPAPFGSAIGGAPGPFGAASGTSSGSFGASSAGPFSGGFGGAPAQGMPTSTSNSNLFGAGGNQAAPFGGNAFGSTGSLNSLAPNNGMGMGMGMGGMNSNNMNSGMGMGMGMGGNSFGQQASQGPGAGAGGAGGFSLGAADKSKEIAGRRKVKVKGRP